jgi:methionine-gamma-lyase
MNKEEYSSMNSVAIHAAAAMTTGHAHLVPIYASSTFTFDSAEQGMNRFSGKEPGFIYSRFGNPTTEAAASTIAALEAFGLVTETGIPLDLKALLHASGQNAMATMFLANLSAGDAVLSHYSLYGGTHEFLYGFLKRFGIHAEIADLRNSELVEDTIKKNPAIKIIHLETPANPTMQCVNIEQICSIAKKYKLKVTVDNTFATPYLQQPFKYGVDFVFHSTTKFLNGHGTAIGGVLLGKDVSFMNGPVYETYKLLGGNSNPFDAYLLLQGIKTLAVRMDMHCRNAMKVAEYLSTHQAVAVVHYNGLPTHSDYEISRQQMRQPGAVLSFELKNGFEQAKHFIDKLKMCVRAVSVGTADSLLSHPASMSHSGMSRDDRYKSGITDGLIRMSVGLEHIDDILNDLEQALKS